MTRLRELLPGGPAPTPASLLQIANDLRRRGAEHWQFVAVGEPALHVYRRADGAAVVIVARYPSEGGEKAIRPFTWRRDGWQPSGTLDARLPLYRLPELLAERERIVLLVEGEKAADAAARLFPAYVVGCPMGGSSPRSGTDWEPLADRSVLVSGDADGAGQAFERKVARALEGSAERVAAVPAHRLYAFLSDERPPVGWDLADAPGHAARLFGDVDLAALATPIELPSPPVLRPSFSRPSVPGREDKGAIALAGRVLGEVQEAPRGERNRTLHRAACAIAGLDAAGRLVLDDWLPQLREAAGATGLPEREIRDTIRSACRKPEPIYGRIPDGKLTPYERGDAPPDRPAPRRIKSLLELPLASPSTRKDA